MDFAEGQKLAKNVKPMPEMGGLPSENYPADPRQFYVVGKPMENPKQNQIGESKGYYTLSGPNARAEYGVGDGLVETGVPYPFRVWPKVPAQINCHLCKRDGMTFFTWRRNKEWLYGSFCCLLFGIIPGIVIFF